MLGPRGQACLHALVVPISSSTSSRTIINNALEIQHLGFLSALAVVIAFSRFDIPLLIRYDSSYFIITMPGVAYVSDAYPPPTAVSPSLSTASDLHR
jgi:hypothetical protein